MFYTYAEKVRKSPLEGWHIREVAFDTRSRYLYYTDPLTLSIPEKPPPMPSRDYIRDSSEDLVMLFTEGGVRSPSPSSRNFSGSGEGGKAQVWEAGKPPAEFPISFSQCVRWAGKMKVVNVVAVATLQQLDPDDPDFCENDFYLLRIAGEALQLRPGESPPFGPLLCPSAGFNDLHLRCDPDDDECIEDPNYLIELFEAIGDQFEETKSELYGGRRAWGVSQQSSPLRKAPVFPAQVDPQPARRLESPDSTTNGAGRAPRLREITLRCRNELEFRRFEFVLQSVLGYAGLMPRPHAGLPPYDPLNGVTLASVPMPAWHAFVGLETCVFYALTRGDLLRVRGGSEETRKGSEETREGSEEGWKGCEVLHAGGYLCVTPEAVLYMRGASDVVWGLEQRELAELNFAVRAGGEPFVALLPDAREAVIFVPRRPPEHGRARPVFDVRRIVRVLHDVGAAALDARRAVRIREVDDASAAAYVRRVGESAREAKREEDGPPAARTALGRPMLLKEELARMWASLQAELHARGNVAGGSVKKEQPKGTGDKIEGRRKGNAVLYSPFSNEEEPSAPGSPNTPEEFAKMKKGIMDYSENRDESRGGGINWEAMAVRTRSSPRAAGCHERKSSNSIPVELSDF